MQIMQLAYMMRSATIQTQTPPHLYTRTEDDCGCLFVSSVGGTGMSTQDLDILEAVLG
jgi:hypothetical protein